MSRFLSRRPLAFSLRTLMVLVTLCALVVWFGNGRRIAGERRSILERRRAGEFYDIAIYERPPEYLPWMRRVLGDTAAIEIQIYEEASPQDVAEVRRAFREGPVRWFKELSPGKYVVTKEVFPSADPAAIRAARAALASP
jgi:hypothetical protein